MIRLFYQILKRSFNHIKNGHHFIYSMFVFLFGDVNGY